MRSDIVHNDPREEEEEIEDQFTVWEIDEDDDDAEEEVVYDEMPPLVGGGTDTEGLPISGWLPPSLPPSKKFFAYSTYVDKNGVIYVHEFRHEYTLEDLNYSLARHYERFELAQPGAHWAADEPCVAYHPDKNKYYRSRILEVDAEKSECTVQYVDYGNIETHPFANLRKGTPMRHIPSLAYSCKLFSSRPIGGIWTAEAVNFIDGGMIDVECTIQIYNDIRSPLLAIDLYIDWTRMADVLPKCAFEFVHCSCQLRTRDLAHRIVCPSGWVH